MRHVNIYGEEVERGALCLTGEDWRLGRGPTGHCGYDWVYPERENRTKEEWNYSYSDHFNWRNEEREELKTAQAEYSDRMAQWGHAKFQTACATGPKQHFRYWTPAQVSKFLTAYFGKPIRAVALSEGCNVSSGYPYWVFWFRDATPKRSKK